ncbi:GNAT family N-acetyltransferase [Fluviicola sp.]|uniref:GNAT family N-acetyltransferase n=1 Tax=Fluviicola sp. TaxID=1917219 RepID=UPI0031D05CB9
MQFVSADSPEIKRQWDELVSLHRASVFSESIYLDATSEYWSVLFSDDRKSGMACPYVVKGGMKVLVTPFFNRYMEWIGDPVSEEVLIAALKREFPVADLQLGNGFSGNQRIFQQLEPGKIKLNQQAKRSVNKASGFTVTQEENIPAMMKLLQDELQNRIHGINGQTLPILEKLVNRYSHKRLVQFNLLHEKKWLGGIWILETDSTVLYLKGTTVEEAKKSGGMYKLMLHAIEYAASKDKKFDFGGSNVESVRRFNLNFGAQDIVYSHVSWNNAPFWWRTVKKIRDKWTKK